MAAAEARLPDPATAPSSCGKSTLLKILGGLLRPSSREVTPVEGHAQGVRVAAGEGLAAGDGLATHAPLTMRGVKEATRRMLRHFALDELEDLLLSCYLSADSQEGVSAFLEKRPARFRGQGQEERLRETAAKSQVDVAAEVRHPRRKTERVEPGVGRSSTSPRPAAR